MLALVVGAGRLGADVGGVITIGAAAGAAAVMMLPGGLTRRSAAIAILAPVAGLALLAAVDLTTGGDSHFTRTVLRADDSGALWDIVARRYELAGRQAIRGLMPAVTLIAILAIAVGVRQRERRARAGRRRPGLACGARRPDRRGHRGVAVQRLRARAAAVRDLHRRRARALPAG